MTHASPKIRSLLLATECHTGGHIRNTFGPTGGRNVQWREANMPRQRQTNKNHGLLPPPSPPPPNADGDRLVTRMVQMVLCGLINVLGPEPRHELVVCSVLILPPPAPGPTLTLYQNTGWSGGFGPNSTHHNDNVASPCSVCLHVQGGLGGTTKECTPPATVKERAMHARNPQSGGVLAPHALQQF